MSFLSPAFLTAPSAMERLTRSFADKTFSGIHELAWFDITLLSVYFTLLTILAAYGFHRFMVIWGYFRHRKRIPQQPPSQFAELPFVTVQLPLYNERNVVDQLLDAVLKLDYPREKLEIQVLDDSTDDTHPYTEALVSRLRAQGHPVEYRHRATRHGFKAGALQEGMAAAKGDLFAIFDADFVPSPDFLRQTVHFFSDPRVGVVQTRWTYLNRHRSLLTEVQALMLDGHFALEHVARYGGGLFFNFNGTAGLLRRQMIDEAGGWQHDTLTEDSDLSYRAQLKGWRFVYCPWVEAPSELPEDTLGFQVQQARWAKGLTQVALKLLPSILRSQVPVREKVEAWFHLTPNFSYPLMVVVSFLMLPVMICRFYIGWLELLIIDAPLIICSFWSVVTFYLLSQQALYPRSWKRSVVFLPALLAMGAALTISNTKAVLEALFGVQTAFARTAKSGSRPAVVHYKRRSGWLPFAELAMGTMFLAMMIYSINVMNMMVLPFLSLFVSGYYWAGFSTLWQEHQGRLQFERERRRVEVEAAS